MIAVQLTASDEVCITGSADFTSAPALEQLEKHLRIRSHIVLNVAKLEFVDTTFLRFLIRLRAPASGRHPATVKLVGVGEPLQRALQVTGLRTLFKYDTR
jgi:anti-anti-sigma factor